MRYTSRGEGLNIKKPTLSALADDIRAESPPSSPSKRIRAGTVNATTLLPHVELAPIPIPLERRLSRKRSNSIGETNVCSSPTVVPTSPSLKESSFGSLNKSSPLNKSSLRLHLEKRKSRFNLNDTTFDSPIESNNNNNRPATPSFTTDDTLSQTLTTRLHAACSAGKIEQLTMLLDKDDQKDPNSILDLNTKHLDADCNRCTLMHTAAKHGRVPIMHLLWARGSSVDTLDSLDASPLFYAAASGSLRACAFLLAKNAQPNLRDRFDNTPLSIAMRSNHYDIARLLLFFKADIHFKVSSKGQTLLHLACEEGSESKVSFLLENNAAVSRTNREDETPLFNALKYPSIVKLLCQHVLSTGSANLIKLIRTINSAGETVIHVAVKNNNLDSLLVIIESIPVPIHSKQLRELLNDNEKTFQNNTPLHLAVIKNHASIVKLLVMCDEIDMAKQNANGDTALHLAVRDRKGELVFLLKQFDFDKKTKLTKNSKKLTPKQLAKDMKAMETYYFSPDSPEYHSSRTLISPREDSKMKRFINTLKITQRKISPRAQFTSQDENDTIEIGITEQRQREYVKQLRMTLKADSVKPLGLSSYARSTLSVKTAPPPPPPSVTVSQVAERIEDLSQLLSYEGDFNSSSAGRVVIMDAAASFVRITRLYVSAIDKEVSNASTPDRQCYFEKWKEFLGTIQDVCFGGDGSHSLTLSIVEEWKDFIFKYKKLPSAIVTIPI